MTKQLITITLLSLLLLTSCGGAAKDVQPLKQRGKEQVNTHHLISNQEKLETFAAASSRLILQDEGNQLYGPVGPYLLLSLLAEGASGETKKEITEVLASSIEERATLTQFNHDLIKNYRDEKTIKIANSIWVDTNTSLEKPFVKSAEANYQAKVTKVPFAKETKRAGETIATWVERELGADLYDRKQVTADSKLILLNTIRLNLAWEEPFDPNLTIPEPFYAKSAILDTPFMHKSIESQAYYQGDGFMASSLPLKNATRLMLILPEEGVAVRELFQTKEQILELFSIEENQHSKFNIGLPTLSFENELDLKKTLKQLGVQQMFDDKQADFSELSTTMPLVVDSFLQKNQFALDEEKVEVKSYTEVGMTEATAAFQEPEEIVQFILNRPFAFINFSETNLPLFMGIIDHP